MREQTATVRQAYAAAMGGARERRHYGQGLATTWEEALMVALFLAGGAGSYRDRTGTYHQTKCRVTRHPGGDGWRVTEIAGV